MQAIEVTMEEARAPMGMLKIDHIRAMLSMPRISTYGKKNMEEYLMSKMWRIYMLNLNLHSCLP